MKAVTLTSVESSISQSLAHFVMPIALGLALSSALLGCSMNRAGSLRMLDERAAYEQASQPVNGPYLKEAGLDGFRNGPVPVRTRPKVAAVWVHPHETTSRDYFWGGWVSVVIEQDQWILSKPQAMPQAPGISGQAPERKGQAKGVKSTPMSQAPKTDKSSTQPVLTPHGRMPL